MEPRNIESNLELKPSPTTGTGPHVEGENLDPLEVELFSNTTDGVSFRTVGWPRAAGIFLKVLFATGVLSIPTAMASLGAVPGSLLVIGWGASNTYNAIVQGNFRNAHPGCHTIADMAQVVGGPWLKEAVGVIYMVAWILATGSGIIGVAVGLNAVSHHALCTVWFTFISTLAICIIACVRKFHQIGWLTWAGFISVFVAVLVVVIGVTTQDRPAAAPQEGPFELGFHAVLHPSFVAGMTASTTIFVSTSGTSAFIPVISEMKNPKDYNKAVYWAMGFVNASYLAFSLVVYRWCGTWVASPSLASAGGTIKVVSYGIALLGLLVSGCLFLHVAAKYVFVRVLRGTRHLQANTMVHWSVWLGCVFGLGALAFLLAEAIPVFNYMLALLGSICFAPLAIMLPGWFWLYSHPHYRTGGFKLAIIYYLHCAMVAFGIFIFVGGTYATIQSIVDLYDVVGSQPAFSCADNSNSS